MNSNRPLTRRLALVCGLALGLFAQTNPARAQFQPETGATAAASEAETLDTGPTTLPGQQLGPRTRTEPKPEKPAPQEPSSEEPAEWFGGKPWTEWSHATGNWGGLRDRLDKAGITINGSYVLDWSFVL